ncbi:hypothetical protein B1748_31715 [Paenibacillus sp. MY03]|uniref:S-layer homology domain-containing protein n=1 Tax=Paenibacillus sp. MY03 TaxID=302980 RepID=UPI000B3CBE07|nr:S-layer homology domain-containing protein [Paenibacillus sp. MY03]OUS69186.1 hypothetical protein B1748_31715 [Paenibacillus sp. MY03]
MNRITFLFAPLLALLLGVSASLQASVATAAPDDGRPVTNLLLSQANTKAMLLAQANAGAGPLALPDTHASTTSAKANADARFRLDWSMVDGRIQVAVHADRLENLYAYELDILVAPDKLKLLDAVMPTKGFSLAPKLVGNTLKLVFTKIGNVTGHAGSTTLAQLTFERIGAGDAKLTILNASLVDSMLSQLDLQPADATTVIPAHAGGFAFTDIAGHWAESIVKAAAAQGWVTGYEDASFRPDLPVSRAQLAALLVRAYGRTADGSELSFSDSASIAAWAKPYAAAVQAAGFMNGYDDGSFRPDRPVSRAELSVVIARALGLEPASGSQAASPDFADAELIPTWARPAATALQEASIMRGRGGNRFAPLETATRAEVCALILKALDNREIPASGLRL